MRDRAAQDHCVQLVRPVDVSDKLPAPAQQAQIFDPLQRAAD
jgi:hypothetical protein